VHRWEGHRANQKLTRPRGGADRGAVAGYLIPSIAFVLAFALGATGAGRPRVVLGLGAVLALGWIATLSAGPTDVSGQEVIPLWLLAGLVALLYFIWCGGLWLGLRVRRARAH
jgi:hypothetical protein